jgi:hypothetical protein
MVFFFQKKKQKALFRFAEGLLAQTSAKPTHGVWGHAPRNQLIGYKGVNWSSDTLLFPEKEAKSVVPLRGRIVVLLGQCFRSNRKI